MTELLEQRLTAEFREYAAGVQLDANVVAAAADRHRRRTNVRRGMLACGMVGVAAAVSTALVLGDGARPPVSAQRPPAAEAQTPELRLAAAVQGTAQTSFRLRITRTRSYDTSRLAGYSDSEEYAGAFDAVTDRGYLRFGPSRVRGRVVGTPIPAEMRIIGDDVYLGRPGAKTVSRHIPRSDLADLLGTATPADKSIVQGFSADPAVLLKTLRHLGSVTATGRSGTGSAAVDTYTFVYRVEADDSRAAHQVTGRAEIGVGTHLLARIVQQTRTVGANPEVADRQPLTWRTVISFADYGVAVQVDKPVVTAPTGRR